MPDMSGWSKEDVVAFEQLTNIKVDMKGSGYVSDQSVSQGTKVGKKDKVTVSLSAEDIDGTEDHKKQDLETSKDGKKDKDSKNKDEGPKKKDKDKKDQSDQQDNKQSEKQSDG